LNLALATWKEDIQNAKVVIGVFLDLRETIDRVILLYLMQLEGIDDEELSWFRDYLSGRKQRTKFGESTSSEQFNELGVVHASCLHYLYFIWTV
jgi:hypothetical protein